MVSRERVEVVHNRIFSTIADAVQTITSPGSRYFLPYLLLTVMLALAICYWRAGSLRRAFRAVWRPDIFLHRSSINDYKIAGLNFLMIGLVFGSAVGSVVVLTRHVPTVLAAVLGEPPAWHPGLIDSLLFGFTLLVAFDAGNFIQHWLQHKVPILWELHKVHHSAEVMTPVTAVRVHPLSQLFASAMVSAVIGLVNGLFLYLYDGPVAIYTLFGGNAFIVLHYTIGAYHLQHSHIWVSFPRVFQPWLISPAMHMIHHSANPRHFDKNFAFVFSVWDRMAGTLYIPDDSEQYGLVLGLGEEEQAELQTVWQLYTTPLKRAARLLVGVRARRVPKARQLE